MVALQILVLSVSVRIAVLQQWKIGRVAYGTCLENKSTEMYREFESLIFRTMRKEWFIIFIATCVLSGCKTIKYVPIKETEYVHIKDSIYLRDTTIQYKIERQYVRDYTGLLDTLRLETDYAESESYIDTTKNALVGSIRNKDRSIDIPIQYKERVVYKDSIRDREVPVPVEKIAKTHYPYEKWLWIWSVLSALIIGLAAYFKLRH